MGLDGGTIATRSDILRRSSIRLADGDNTRSTRGGCISHAHISEVEQEHPSTKYVTCALSSEPLDTGEGIVACRLGYLYNISAFNDYLFKEGMFSSSRSSIVDHTFDHLRDIDDVVSVNISIINGDKNKSDGHAAMRQLRCPATEILANGAHKFVVLWSCGCVLSHKVIKMMSNHNKKQSQLDCPCCGHVFDKKVDVVVLHPPRDKVEHIDSVASMITKEKLQMLSSNDSSSLSALSIIQSESIARGQKRQLEIQSGDSGAMVLSSGLSSTTHKEAPISSLVKHHHMKAPSKGLIIGSQAIQKAKLISEANIKLKAKVVNQNPNAKKRKELSSIPTLSQRLSKEGWERLESKSKPGLFYFRNVKLKITQWTEPI